MPIATNEPMSWSNEYISVTSRGVRPSTFGSVIAAGGLKMRARRLNGDDEARLLAEAGHHRHLVAVDDGDADAAGLRAAGERHLAGANVSEKPGASGIVSVPPPVVGVTHSWLARC